jgi:hypothetical protein
MPFSLEERRNSGAMTVEPPTVIRRYRASGEFDRNTVLALAVSLTPLTVLHPTGGLLYRQDIALDPAGHKLYYLDIPYAQPSLVANPNSNGTTYEVSFDTTGGSVHITCSRGTVSAWGDGASVSDHMGAIGVSGPDKQPDGAEIVVPALKLTVKARNPAGVITLAQIKNLARWTGRINSDYFLTFSPGEVLFLGCTGTEGTATPTEISFHFACSENLFNLSVGGITIGEKLGHDLYWIQFKPAIANNAGTRQPKAVYVERVYGTVPMAAALGFGA